MVKRDLQFFGARLEVCLEVTVAETGLPLQLPARVLALVERRKDLLILGEVQRYMHLVQGCQVVTFI